MDTETCDNVSVGPLLTCAYIYRSVDLLYSAIESSFLTDTMSLSETPSVEAGVVIRHKHTPPDEQLQGGSWELDTVTGAYHMLSSAVRDGRMIPSPGHPLAYDQVYKIAAELARAGIYSLVGTFSPLKATWNRILYPKILRPS